MMILPAEFREFIELLNLKKVEYIIVGGYALAFHGKPRYTGDIDFWINRETSNLQRMLSALDAFGFGSLGITAESFEEDSVVQLGYPPLRIDLLTGLTGLDWDEAFLASEIIKLDGVEVRMLDRASLIKNKTSIGRLKDLADIEDL